MPYTIAKSDIYDSHMYKVPSTVLFFFKLTKIPVPLRLQVNLFVLLFHHILRCSRTLNIVWSLVRRRVTRVRAEPYKFRNIRQWHNILFKLSLTSDYFHCTSWRSLIGETRWSNKISYSCLVVFINNLFIFVWNIGYRIGYAPFFQQYKMNKI